MKKIRVPAALFASVATLPVMAMALSPVLAGQNPTTPAQQPGQEAGAKPGGDKAPAGPPQGGPGAPDPFAPDLNQAILAGDVTQVKALLAKGANANSGNFLGMPPLFIAAVAGNIPVCEALLEKGADIKADTSFGGVIELGAMGGHAPIIQYLLDKGAPLSKSRGDGYTALMTAAENGNVAIVKAILAARKPDINAADKAGMTALAHASRRGQAEAVRFLLSAGAKAETTDAFGRTPLMHAAQNGYPQVVKMLLEKGAKASAKDKNGDTPLILAAKYSGDAETARILTKAGGASVAAIKDAQGRTAANIARLHGYTGFVAVLEPAKAKTIAVAADKSIAPTARQERARQAVLRGLPLLESTTKNFTAASQACSSCHHQGVGLMTTGTLKSLGYLINNDLAKSEQKTVTGFIDEHINDLRGIVDHPEAYKHLPGADINELVPGISTTIAALTYHDAPTNEGLEIATRIMAGLQEKDGSWAFGFHREPMQSSRFTFTAYVIKVMQAYMPASLAKERDERIAKAIAWLIATPATNNEDRTFKLLALKWANAPLAEIEKAKADLIKTQRSDGGWAQFNTPNPAGDGFRRSDAYATGQALYALHIGGGMAADDAVYRRGVDYLIRTQDDDGSWFVNKRAIQANTYFDTGFPHGESQYISYGGTAWAMMALGFASGEAPAKTASAATR